MLSSVSNRVWSGQGPIKRSRRSREAITKGDGEKSYQMCAMGSKHDWLVVEQTPLKNMSQLGWLSPIYGKAKNVPNHQPDEDVFFFSIDIHSLVEILADIPRIPVMDQWPTLWTSKKNVVTVHGISAVKKCGHINDLSVASKLVATSRPRASTARWQRADSAFAWSCWTSYNVGPPSYLIYNPI